MKTIELLLREPVRDLGRPGDIVKVATGYARNYLLPRRLAVAASEENKRIMVRRRAVFDAEEAAREKEVTRIIELLGKIELKTVQRADDNGHLYGSVNTSTIIELLEKAGHKFEEKAVRLGAPIKAVGKHAFQLHVHGDQYAEVKIEVEAEIEEKSEA